MKTAISIPDQLFRRADRLAKKLRVSRSEVFARAMEDFLRARETREIKESYDVAFGPDAGDDENAEFRRAAARRTLADIEW